MIYAVNYDLKKPGQDYSALYEAIKGCGAWWHFLGSTWLVDTSLTADGIWLLVHEAAHTAGLGTVAPHDLRRSVAGALQATGVPIDTISRLLRHSNVAVTERYLSKLPQRNPGALLMSDLLELDGQ